MRKLYQILYNVGRLTDAPGGGLFLSRGDTLAVGLFPFLGDTLAWAGFPFWGTLWRGQVSLSGGHFGVGRFARGKGARSYEARFSPSRSPFPGTSLFCAVVWGSVLANACMLLYWWRQAEPIFFRRTEGGLRSRPVPGGCCIAGANLLLPVVLLLALICSCLLSHHWHKPAPINNREQARCAGRFPVRRNKNRLSLTLPIQQHTGLSR